MLQLKHSLNTLLQALKNFLGLFLFFFLLKSKFSSGATPSSIEDFSSGASPSSIEDFSDVLEISAKSEGKRSHRTRDYPRTTGNSRHPSAQVTEKGHGHAATGQGHATAGSLRTPGLWDKRKTFGTNLALTVFAP